MKIAQLIKGFLANLGKEYEVYNEFSLQHELGIYLRKNAKGYRVEFERNTNYFNMPKLIKKEIDIVVYNDKSERYAIELKYPRNGQYPEQMYSFLKDIKFMEQVKAEGFKQTYALALVEDSAFYEVKKSNERIYQYFRGENNIPIHSKIFKPTGKEKDIAYIELDGKYKILWNDLDCFGQNDNYKYYLLEI